MPDSTRNSSYRRILEKQIYHTFAFGKVNIWRIMTKGIWTLIFLIKIHNDGEIAINNYQICALQDHFLTIHLHCMLTHVQGACIVFPRTLKVNFSLALLSLNLAMKLNMMPITGSTRAAIFLWKSQPPCALLSQYPIFQRTGKASVITNLDLGVWFVARDSLARPNYPVPSHAQAFLITWRTRAVVNTFF